MTGYVLTAMVAYFIGSIPTGYLFGRARGIDIRTSGSGNIGATNVFRTLGRSAGIAVLLIDALKGFLPTRYLLFGATPETREFHSMVAALFAILGHNYTCWLRFKGGKGVATSGGVLAALVPWAFLITLATWLLVIWLSRYVSLGSLVAATVLPVATYFTQSFTQSNRALLALTAVIGLLVIWRHRANFQRLRAGTESKLGAPRNPDPPAPAVNP